MSWNGWVSLKMNERGRSGDVPTLSDVARRADVSTATVSRCLNLPDRVVPKTRERVMRAVRELGYSPNFGARALAGRQTHTVGAVIPTMDNAIFARGIQAFQEELGHLGKTLLIASSGYDEEVEAVQVRTLVARGAEALLLIGYHRHPDIYEMLKMRRVPTLVAWAFRADAPQMAIGFDNVAAMAGLARIAIGQGHRRFGFISAHRASNDRARDRVTGIRLAMDEAGLAPSSLTVVETEYGIETGGAAFARVMAIDPPPTVVFCGNDVLAVGALRAARSMGRRVPHDVSITGFDDIELAVLADPALTTVHVPHREMGRRAAQILVNPQESGGHSERIELKTSIILRESLGPPL